MKRLAVLLLLCLYTSGLCAAAYGAALEKLRADLEAAAPYDRAGVAIGFIGPTAETILFAGKAPFDETTLFEYGSLTKVLTAILLAKLADEGTVRLTDSVDKYLPEDVKHGKWRGVTLRMLATHTAGLPRLPPNMNLFYTLRHGKNPYAVFDEAMLFDAVRRVRLEPAGELNSYSNFGFGLLGTIFSRAAQTPYASLVEARIFRPLGMSGASIAGWSSEKVAPPLTRRGDKASHWDFAALAGAGAARGSVADAMKFLRASMTACEASSSLARANCRAQQATEVRAGEHAAQGLGWIRTASPAGDVVWHNGGTGGFSSFLGFNVRTKEGLVVLANVADAAAVTNLSLDFLARLE